MYDCEYDVVYEVGDLYGNASSPEYDYGYDYGNGNQNQFQEIYSVDGRWISERMELVKEYGTSKAVVITGFYDYYNSVTIPETIHGMPVLQVNTDWLEYDGDYMNFTVYDGTKYRTFSGGDISPNAGTYYGAGANIRLNGEWGSFPRYALYDCEYDVAYRIENLMETPIYYSIDGQSYSYEKLVEEYGTNYKAVITRFRNHFNEVTIPETIHGIPVTKIEFDYESETLYFDAPIYNENFIIFDGSKYREFEVIERPEIYGGVGANLRVSGPWSGESYWSRYYLYNCEHNIAYKITDNNENKTITIIAAFDFGEIIIPAYIDDIPVTAIGEYAFMHSNVSTVTIPYTVTYIYEYVTDNQYLVVKGYSGSAAETFARDNGYEFIDLLDKIGIEIAKLPDKLEYNLSETLDLTGLEVLLKYNNEKSELITEYLVSDVDLSTVGEKIVVISYGDYSTEFTINVVDSDFIDTDFDIYMDTAVLDEKANTVSEIKSKITTNMTVNIVDAMGNYIADSSKVGTGATIKIVDANGELVESIMVVVSGDIDGDGYVSKDDYTNIYSYITLTDTLEGAYFAAADLNRDGSVDGFDAIYLDLYLNGYMDDSVKEEETTLPEETLTGISYEYKREDEE